MTSSMSPAALESQTLQFLQLCKLQTNPDRSKNVYKNRTNLVATCSAYGLIFIGENAGFRVVVSGKIYENSHNFNPKNVLSSYMHRTIPLPSPPSHIDVSSDQQLLSVTYNMKHSPFLRIYTIESIFSQTSSVRNEIRLSSVPGTLVNDLMWNPGIPNMLACCISDGTMNIYTFGAGSSFDFKGLPKEANATCLCWSPKGKQIVVGNINGFLTQYTPELKAMKNYAPPSGIFSKPCTITSLKWLSPFQFIGVYNVQEQFVTNDEEIQVCIVVVNTPKNAPVTYVNYEDICYSSGNQRPTQFYFLHIPQWNVVFVVSANAIEVGVLGFSPDENLWYQWNLEESARVVLPMNKADETFPVGVAIDYSSQIQTPIGDKVVAMPVFTILNDEGLLCLYLINNFVQNIPSICSNSNSIPNLQYFSSEDVSNQAKNEPVVPQATPAMPQAATVPQTSIPTSQMTAPTATTSQLNFASDTRSYSTPGLSFNMNATSSPLSNFGAPSSLTSISTNVSTAQMNTGSQFTSVLLNQKPGFLPQTPPPMNASRPVIDVKNEIQKPPVPVSTPVSYTSTIQQPQPPQNQAEDANQKALILQKKREEAFKDLKKKAFAFESEIQEFQQLTASIQVQASGRPCENIISQLKAKNNILKELNDNVRNEIDNLKTSIIEVTACIKDIKSKYFLLTNPGYRTLSAAQALDPSSVTALKNIESNIHYVQSQIELADKKLDEMWYKFCEDSPQSTTKVPKLENIYRTIVVQQKILKVRKLEMQSLEKNLKKLRYQMSLEFSSRRINTEYSNKSFEIPLLSEDQALAELTKNVLSLGTNSSNQLDPISLSEKCTKEYAKRFQLSFNKQTKLQELYGAIDTVNYIRSAKLERSKRNLLKKQSKSISAPESTSDFHPQTLISPVSSDDDRDIKNSPVSQPVPVVSSTPKKNGTKMNFNLESSFNEEPSAIAPVSQPHKTIEPEVVPNVMFPLPSSTSAFRVNKHEVEVEKPTFVSPLSDKSVDKENVPKSSAVNTTPITFGSFSRAFQASNQVTTSATVITTQSTQPTSLFFGMKPSTAITTSTTNTTGASFFGGLKLAPSTTPSSTNLTQSSISPTMGTPLFAQNFASNVATNANVLKDVTGAMNLAQKEKPKVTPASTIEIPTPSLFGTKPSPLSTTGPVSTVTITTTSASNDKPVENPRISSTSTPVNIPALVTIAFTAPAAPAPVPSQTSIFGKPAVSAVSASPAPVPSQASIFGKPAASAVFASVAPTPSSGSSIFGSSSLFGKTTTPSSAADAINFGGAFSSSSSIFGMKSTPTTIATVAPSVQTSTSSSKSDIFTSFSFASKPTTTVAETVPEVTSTNTREESSSTSESTSSAVINTFSFANATSTTATFGTSTVQSESNNVSVTLTLTPTSSPIYGSPSTPISAVSSTPPTMVTPPSTSAAALNTPPTSSAAFAGSFFGGLSISATTTTAGATSSIFGKPATGTSSIFGGNAFSQKANITPTTSTESKPIFGTGSSLFGQSSQSSQENKGLFAQSTGQENKSVFGMAQSTATNQENKSLFGQQPQAQGGFQSGGGSVFGNSTGGSSLFGSGNAFSGMPATTQSNTFGSSGGSLFGSGPFSNTTPNSSFQGTAGGFGSPPSFGNNTQQQQSPGGFGSPPAFSGVFNKPAGQFSTFGSAPTFGGSPAFGSTSPNKLFGQNTPAMGSFGGAAQQPTSFENLANENTIGFGNLAQQPPSAGFGSPPSFGAAASPPAFGSSSFGGNSFSSWR